MEKASLIISSISTILLLQIALLLINRFIQIKIEIKYIKMREQQFLNRKINAKNYLTDQNHSIQTARSYKSLISNVPDEHLTFYEIITIKLLNNKVYNITPKRLIYILDKVSMDVRYGDILSEAYMDEYD
jgi:hypothetical protein